ncbi:hypothetical protein KSP40_PGU015616 [Platanthera guangdongensis]|uniref:Uncharacterized protein n=1 Tax=Platanthera guangdongensis TaxID=2320717 RepID=A0ABR2LE27_9ASPA
MPASQDPAISLREQFDHLLRDWDNYKTSIPRRHRRLHSGDLYFTPVADPGHLRSPLEKPASHLHRPHSGRRLLDAFEKAKEAPAAESEGESSPRPRPRSSCSSLTDFEGEGLATTTTASSSYEENASGGAKREARSWDRWFLMLRWLAIVMAAAAVVVFSLRAVLAADELPQFVIPT